MIRSQILLAQVYAQGYQDADMCQDAAPCAKIELNTTPTTQLAKMSIDPKFVELTADVLEIFL